MTYIKKEKIAVFGDKVLTRVLALWPTLKEGRHDLMNPFVEQIPWRTIYNKYVTACPCHKLQDLVANRNGGATTTVKYDPAPEIEDKGLEKFFDAFNQTPFEDMDVRYFTKTEHQIKMPMRCTFKDYQIDFGGVGTEWCGGRGGDGCVFKRTSDGFIQIAVISPKLSKYFSDEIIKRVKLQKEITR